MFPTGLERPVMLGSGEVQPDPASRWCQDLTKFRFGITRDRQMLLESVLTTPGFTDSDRAWLVGRAARNLYQWKS